MFKPILESQSIDYVLNNKYYRNTYRESLAGGTPVFFTPRNTKLGELGHGGPKYELGKTYYNSTSAILGGCTWWCNGRVAEADGIDLPNLGDGGDWYDKYTGEKSIDYTRLREGDVIVLTDTGEGHVMFVESIVGNKVTVSQSASSRRAIWKNKACLVNTYNKTDFVEGAKIDMYKDLDTSYHLKFKGFLHLGEKTDDISVYEQLVEIRDKLNDIINTIE